MAQTVANMKAKLRSLITEWEEDDCHPANYVRKNGMGDEIARVDRWCGGFQDPHKPVTIGWRVQVGNRTDSGIVMVDQGPLAEFSVPPAVSKAKALANKALAELQKGRR